MGAPVAALLAHDVRLCCVVYSFLVLVQEVLAALSLSLPLPAPAVEAAAGATSQD